jgi:hypothetical protein
MKTDGTLRTIFGNWEPTGCIFTTKAPDGGETW